MIRRILPATFEKDSPKRMKKFFHSHLNAYCYTSVIPKVKQATVGSIPNEVVNLFGNNKAAKAKVFLKGLANITYYLRAAYYNLRGTHEYDLKKVRESTLQAFETKASHNFTEFTKRLFPQGTRAKIKFAGRGEFGSVYQLSLVDKNGKKLMHDKALKVYHQVIDKEEGWHAVHGNFAEANFWTYIKYNAGHALSKTQFTKHYISDMKSAYALTEFIDDDIPKTKKELDLFNLFKIRDLDRFGNKPINGKCYDAGLYFREFDFINDKMVLRYLKKLYYRSKKDLKQVYENLTAQANNPKNEHRTKIKQAIEAFNERFPDRLEWLK